MWIVVSLSFPLSSPSSFSELRLPQFVVYRLPAPGDLWFMGSPVSHNKAVSNEVMEGDLFVHACACAQNQMPHRGTCTLIYSGYISKWWTTRCRTPNSVAYGTDTDQMLVRRERWHWNCPVWRGLRSFLLKEHALAACRCATNKCRPRIPLGFGSHPEGKPHFQLAGEHNSWRNKREKREELRPTT